MTRPEYLGLPGLNFSAARQLLRSPGHFKAYLEEPEDELKYAVGKLAHAMILEGKDLRDLYAIKPAGLNLATKEGKDWKKEQLLPILKEEDANRVPRMAEAIANHPLASRALRLSAQREVVLQSSYNSVPIKGIIDALGANICEVKTTADARYSAFSKRIAELDYDCQYAWYRSLKNKPLAWIVVENHAPFAVNVFYPGADVITSGQQKMDAAITRFKICQEKDNWSTYMFGDYSHEMQEIGLPVWRIKELEGAGLL
jgi:hypothetical protein